MICPNCRKETGDRVKFCPECGTSVSQVSGAEREVSIGGMRTAAAERGSAAADPRLTGMKTGTAGGLGQTPHGESGASGFPLKERYDIAEKIGEGGFAVVYRARDRKLNRTVLRSSAFCRTASRRSKPIRRSRGSNAKPAPSRR